MKGPNENFLAENFHSRDDHARPNSTKARGSRAEDLGTTVPPIKNNLPLHKKR